MLIENGDNDLPIEPDEHGYYNVVLGAISVPNTDAVLCSPAEVESALSRRLAKGAIYGELGKPIRHPWETYEQFKARYRRIDEASVAFCIEDAKVVTDSASNSKIESKIRILKTPSGIVAQGLLDKIPKVAFAVRAIYDPKQEEPLKIITFDLVASSL